MNIYSNILRFVVHCYVYLHLRVHYLQTHLIIGVISYDSGMRYYGFVDVKTIHSDVFSVFTMIFYFLAVILA